VALKNAASKNPRLSLDASWQDLIGEQFDQPYMQQLSQFLRAEKQRGKRIYPPGDQMFAALNLTPVEQVKVVIIGQDPYHGQGQAHGLCFSVQSGTQLPPSLVNIFKEINSDLRSDIGGSDIGGSATAGTIKPLDKHRGCLTSWARQGVLLLNAVLSVEHSRAASHQGKGWETFTDEVVNQLARTRTGLVFMLWGAYAQRKGAMVNPSEHCLLKSPHPSPLSAHRGFFGCKHFSKANAYLAAQGQTPIDWFSVE
jgi:uracil-DNA glycosylase